MEAKDGSIGFDFEGTYDVVDPYKSISLILDDGRQSRTSFETSGSETRVTTIFEAEDQNPAEMQRDGWQAILDNFKAYVENHRNTPS